MAWPDPEQQTISASGYFDCDLVIQVQEDRRMIAKIVCE